MFWVNARYFCLVAYACTDSFDQRLAERVRNSYFPYVQGLHILLDYLIDQEEDRQGGDLNFCFYYPNEETLFARLCHFVEEADRHIAQLPHREFHRFIHRGLLGLYLSDEKVHEQDAIRKLAKQLLRSGGVTSHFFYWNGRMYRKWQNGCMREENGCIMEEKKRGMNMSLPRSSDVTYEQYLIMRQHSDERLEYIDGVVYMTPSPSIQHQLVSSNLHTIFGNYLKGKTCKVFAALTDIELVSETCSERKLVIPDLSIICDQTGFTDTNTSEFRVNC